MVNAIHLQLHSDLKTELWKFKEIAPRYIYSLSFMLCVLTETDGNST